MDVLMLVFTIVVALGLLVCNVYILAYYCHPDDKGFGSALVCKIFVVIGMALSWSQVLMLPLDVSNNRSFGGGINMQIFWYVIYIATAAMLLIVLPTLSSFYESDPDWSFCQKFKHSFCCFIVLSISLCLICVLLYFLIGKTQIPAESINCSVSVLSSSIEAIRDNVKDVCAFNHTTIELNVSFVIYIIGLMSFVSWFLFAVFGGIGLSALPLDFFYDFCTRPKYYKAEEIAERKRTLVLNCEDLKLLVRDVKEMESKGYATKNYFSKNRRLYQKALNQLKAGVCLAEREQAILDFSNQIKKENNCTLCLYYLLIPLGIICLIITLLWIIQIFCSFIVMNNNRPVYGFLSILLLALQENSVAFLAYFFFGVFCFYLLIATIKGNFKFGLRLFSFGGGIHPMKKDGTYMNSFLFNVSLVLLCSVSVTQFCSASFIDYVSFTDIDLIFSVQIRYLKFFVWFYSYHVFEYLLFGVFWISLLYLLLRPNDQLTIDKMFEDLQKASAEDFNAQNKKKEEKQLQSVDMNKSSIELSFQK